jgi:hypothetical protein
MFGHARVYVLMAFKPPVAKGYFLRNLKTFFGLKGGKYSLRFYIRNN